ncbi:hypothetical protein AQUSIP_20850 [Aquicella siphonis]|uniref:Uncharacterized protein n=1 Tax=Aquicella siphonis TaxID=254247 RepID=A0A5E4PI93_9COXI|nr:hypothetical protein [Aquicella siphonis]VVC76759.1 hypothetical protein AQUSIP_20850 [Aquicella siphonis]
MEKSLSLLIILTFVAWLTACSPIDSVRPFDQEQAAKLIHEKPLGMPARSVTR